MSFGWNRERKVNKRTRLTFDSSIRIEQKEKDKICVVRHIITNPGVHGLLFSCQKCRYGRVLYCLLFVLHTWLKDQITYEIFGKFTPPSLQWLLIDQSLRLLFLSISCQRICCKQTSAAEDILYYVFAWATRNNHKSHSKATCTGDSIL